MRAPMSNKYLRMNQSAQPASRLSHSALSAASSASSAAASARRLAQHLRLARGLGDDELILQLLAGQLQLFQLLLDFGQAAAPFALGTAAERLGRGQLRRPADVGGRLSRRARRGGCRPLPGNGQLGIAALKDVAAVALDLPDLVGQVDRPDSGRGRRA